MVFDEQRAARFRRLYLSLLALGIVTFFVAPVLGQLAAAGTIAGIVTDPQGKTIAGAQVVVKNTDFTWKRVFVTGERGAFTAPVLSAGVYTVEVEAPGLRLKAPVRVALGVGSTVRLDLRLKVAAVSQKVTVTGRGATVEGNTVPPAVNKQEVEVGNVMAGLTVTYLPNRDRDFSQFGQLAAGVQASPDRTGLIIAGQRDTAVKTDVDGADFNDPLQGGQRGSHDSGLFFPQTAVREFEIVHAGAGAEVGGTNAGFINVATKEGSNKLHGEGFYIGRPPLFSSSDAFGHSLDNLQNEFGGSIGGPIRKNRAFFYFGAEQDFLDVPYWTLFQQQAPGISVPSLLQSLQTQTVEHSDPTSIFGRSDVSINARNTLNLQFNFNRIDASNLSTGSTRIDAPTVNRDSVSGDSEWSRGSLTTVLGAKTVNQVLIQWARDYRDTQPNSVTPEIVINGFGTLGGNSLDPHRYTSSRVQFGDDVSITRGAALFQFGGAFAYDPASERHEANLNGRFDFNSLTDYLDNNPRRYQQTFITGDTKYDGSLREAGFYFNGKVPITQHLTLTAGLRWDGQWNPQPGHANSAIAQTSRIPNDLAQWQPRLGVAWNPLSDTVVRVSAGLYDAPTPATLFQRVFTDNGLNTVVADSYFDPEILPLVSTPMLITQPLPAPPPGLTTPAAFVAGIASDFRNPRSFQSAASVQQQVGAKVSVSAGYVHNSTWNLQRRLDVNLGVPTVDFDGIPIFPSVRPNPDIGRLLVNQSSAHSSYNGLLLTANFQLPRRSQLAANYTLSSTRDDDSNLGPFSIDSALNPYDLAAERGYSAFDIRHSFNLSGVTNLPWGFKINPVLVARSGSPYTPLIGLDIQNDANDLNDRAIVNGSVAGRNSFRQPAFFNLDLRFVKDITLRGEGHHLDLFMDVFNITGAENLNFGPQSVSLYGLPADPIFTAGQALFAPDTNHFGSARQIQFTVRLVGF
jgi:Carboxypeptidase regulatory-like domain/TonB dependent receptor